MQRAAELHGQPGAEDDKSNTRQDVLPQEGTIHNEHLRAAELQLQLGAEDFLQEEVQPEDSASRISPMRVKRTCSHSSYGSSLASTTISATRVRQEAEHAALLQHAAALRKKRQLEQEEAQLQQWQSKEVAKIKAKREELEMETALAESSAKLKVLDKYEEYQDEASSIPLGFKQKKNLEQKKRRTVEVNACSNKWNVMEN